MMIRMVLGLMVMVVLGMGCSSSGGDGNSLKSPTGFGITQLTFVKKSVAPEQLAKDQEAIRKVKGVTDAQFNVEGDGPSQTVRCSIRLVANHAGRVRADMAKLGYEISR